MRNFIQPGCTVTVQPAANVLSGDLVVVGSLFGVASGNALAGTDCELKTGGVFDLPKAAGQSLAQGAAVYWDATAKAITTTSTNNTKVGVALLAAASAEVVARVRLNDTF